MTMRGAALVALMAALVVPAPASAAEAGLRQAPAKFPDRAFVLTLPEARDLRPGDVRVSEGGAPVADVRVSAGGRGGQGFATILAIDASNSMRGQPIADAMEAARAFAAERRDDQPLGVVFFSREPAVALEPTTDASEIDDVLAHPPVLSTGTQFYDATATSLDLLGGGGGAVVVLSDGADTGSEAGPDEIAALSAKQGSQVFTVGLRSPDYSGASLSGLSSVAGGEHTTVSGGELRGVFEDLGRQLASRYLVEYRSLASLGAEVPVEVSVSGLEAPLTTAYRAPELTEAALPRPQSRGGASSTPAIAAIAVLVAALLGFAIWLVTRRPTRTIESRVGDYGMSRRSRPTVRVMPRRTLSDGDEASPRWTRFTEELEMAGVQSRPSHVVAGVVLATAGLVWVALLTGRGVSAALLAFTPVGAYVLMRARVARRRRAFADQLADTLQVVASAMRAGHTFGGALAVAVENADEPTRSELGRVVRDEQLGVPIERATAEVARRMDNMEMEQIGLVAALQRDSGGNTAEVLDHLTDTIRERDALRRLVRTLTAQGRTAGLVLSLLPVALALFFASARPDYFDPMLNSAGGQILLGLCAVLIISGWLVIRRVVDIRL